MLDISPNFSLFCYKLMIQQNCNHACFTTRWGPHLIPFWLELFIWGWVKSHLCWENSWSWDISETESTDVVAVVVTLNVLHHNWTVWMSAGPQPLLTLRSSKSCMYMFKSFSAFYETDSCVFSCVPRVRKF